MYRRKLLAGGAATVATAGVSGCLSSLTGGDTREFRPAAEAFNRGIDAFGPAQSTRSTARERFQAEQWGPAAERYVAARDAFDAAAEFDTAREATSGSCPALHNRSQRQYRRCLALVEACGYWAAVATARLAGDDAATAESRATVWDGRAAEYPTATRVDPDGFSCQA
jgi:hypothetical protein